MNTISEKAKIAAVSTIIEGASIRGTGRLVGVHPDTAARYASLAGQGCAILHDRVMRGLRARSLQLDELWTFVQKKQKRVRQNDPVERGDAWVFFALETTSRLLVSFRVGKRTAEEACLFVEDVRRRVVGKPLIHSDGFRPYTEAVERAFGADARFGMLVKSYEPKGGKPDGGRFIGSNRIEVFGPVDVPAIATAYIERQNLTLRMMCRRFARRTNAYSKSIERLREAVALYVCVYNFVRVHETLRVTPAMEAGLTDHPWTLEELLSQADHLRSTPPDVPHQMRNVSGGGASRERVGDRPPLRLIRGGLR